MTFFRHRPSPDEIQSLYRQHGPALLLYACSILRHRHAAEDALHQVFMKLLEQNTLPDEPKPYLFRAMHNAALNVLRNQDSEIEPWFESPSTDPAMEVTLRNELLELPAEQQQVLVLHLWGGLSFEEIGNVLGIPANTAASRYRYALEKLRARMQTGDKQDAD
jgi:RNA polymerase sigma-70 factor (ECF subfamily)